MTAFNPSNDKLNKLLSIPESEKVIESSWGSVTEKLIRISSFSKIDWDASPSIIGLPSFSTSKIVIDKLSVVISEPSEASTVISYWLSPSESPGASKSGFELKVIWPELEIDNLFESVPVNEKPIGSSSTSSTTIERTTNVFSSIEDAGIKSLKTGGSFTLTTSTSTFAVAVVPSTLTE